MTATFQSVSTATPSASVGPSYPSGVLTDDLLIMFYATDGTIGAAPAGWTQLATISQSSVNVAVWWRSATGNESVSAAPVVALTGTITKGIAWIANYRATTSGALCCVQSGLSGVQSTTTSTSISVTGTTYVQTSAASDLILALAVGAATSGTFTAVPSSQAITQAQTMGTYVSRASGRVGSNSWWYVFGECPVSAGFVGYPAFTGTAVGANTSGPALFLQVRECMPATHGHFVAAAFHQHPTGAGGVATPGAVPITVPAGVVSTDVGVLVAASGAAQTSSTWTCTSSPAGVSSTNVQAMKAFNTGQAGALILTGVAAGTVLTIGPGTSSGGNTITYLICWYRGVTMAGATIGTMTIRSASGATTAAPSITPATSDCLIVCAYGNRSGSAGAVPQSASASFSGSAPDQWFDAFLQGTNSTTSSGSTNGDCLIKSFVQASAAATPVVTATFAGASTYSTSSAAVQVALPRSPQPAGWGVSA